MNYTIKDIAAELGVSITTVSLIINNRPCRVSEKDAQRGAGSRQEIQLHAQLLGAGPRYQKTETIGLIVPDISNPFFSSGQRRGTRRTKNNYSVIFCNSDNKAKKDIKNTALLISKQVDGLIFGTLHGRPGRGGYHSVQPPYRTQTPSSRAGRPHHPLRQLQQRPDRQPHRRLPATCHLIELGHRRIGCVTGPINVDSSYKRYSGYVTRCA